jgi:pimeloyl-ACP methyl ester carboxylesterase
MLVLRGANSDLLSARSIAEMERRHPENFTQATVPGRGHAPILDEPVAVHEISRFLEGLD